MREAGGCPEEVAFPGTRFPAARPGGTVGEEAAVQGRARWKEAPTSRLRTEFCCCLWWELGDPETPLLQTASNGVKLKAK